MSQGRIARLTDQGYGFISQKQGRDLFFHSTALVGVSFDDLRPGDSMEYDIEPDPRGRGDRAVNVRRVAQSAE